MSKNGNERDAKALEGEYKDLYQRVTKSLREDVRPGEELEHAISSILQLLLEASDERRPVSELFPDGFDAFYEELLEALPVYSRANRIMKSRRTKIRWISVTVLLGMTIVLGVLWQTGYVGMWRDGIAYMAGALEKYSYNYTVLEEEYEITIDLGDLESNTGKILYDRDGMRIDVAVVDNAGGQGGGYRIHFRSHGKYSIDRAVLVSGNKHYATESRWYSTSNDAVIRSEYNGKQYEGSVAGSSGLNYKDGDMFSFYIFSQQAYQSGEVTLQEKGEVKLTLSRLGKNEWIRK